MSEVPLYVASRLEGHLASQGYEDADGDSLEPLMYIH